MAPRRCGRSGLPIPQPTHPGQRMARQASVHLRRYEPTGIRTYRECGTGDGAWSAEQQPNRIWHAADSGAEAFSELAVDVARRLAIPAVGRGTAHEARGFQNHCLMSGIIGSNASTSERAMRPTSAVPSRTNRDSFQVRVAERRAAGASRCGSHSTSYSSSSSSLDS